MHFHNKQNFKANASGFMHDPLTTKLKKLTPVILLLAILLFFISYGAPYWAEATGDSTRKEHLGLWRYCAHDVNGRENCDDFINYNYNGMYSNIKSYIRCFPISWYTMVFCVP